MSSVLADPYISFNTLPLGPQKKKKKKKEQVAALSSDKLV